MDTGYIAKPIPLTQLSKRAKFLNLLRKSAANILLAGMFLMNALFLYIIVTQLIEINQAKLKTYDNYQKIERIAEELRGIQDEINNEMSMNTIEYKASKNLGMVKQDPREAVVLQVPKVRAEDLESKDKMEEFPSFDFFEALQSILR